MGTPPTQNTNPRKSPGFFGRLISYRSWVSLYFTAYFGGLKRRKSSLYAKFLLHFRSTQPRNNCDDAQLLWFSVLNLDNDHRCPLHDAVQHAHNPCPIVCA